jgi:hypothetical protein
LKDFTLRRDSHWDSLLTQDHLGKCFSRFSHPDPQMLLQLLSKVAQILLKLAADLGIIHVMLILQTCRMQELWYYGSFHQDFKRRPEKPGNVWQLGSLQAAPERSMYETLR